MVVLRNRTNGPADQTPPPSLLVFCLCFAPATPQAARPCAALCAAVNLLYGGDVRQLLPTADPWVKVQLSCLDLASRRSRDWTNMADCTVVVEAGRNGEPVATHILGTHRRLNCNPVPLVAQNNLEVLATTAVCCMKPKGAVRARAPRRKSRHAKAGAGAEKGGAEKGGPKGKFWGLPRIQPEPQTPDLRPDPSSVSALRGAGGML